MQSPAVVFLGSRWLRQLQSTGRATCAWVRLSVCDLLPLVNLAKPEGLIHSSVGAEWNGREWPPDNKSSPPPVATRTVQAKAEGKPGNRVADRIMLESPGSSEL